MKIAQAGLLAFYRMVTGTGVLGTPWGRTFFEATYWLYKAHYEAGPIKLLRNWVRPNSVVIDVGANIGFFTLQFASWMRNGGKVLAIEPEAVNYARLQRAVTKAGLTAAVEALQVAAADSTGEGFLEVNLMHPGDHKLAVNGVRVAMTTLDNLIAIRGWPDVSLIKVDVQGAEARALAGADQTIERFRPALFIEVSDECLKRYGSSAEGLLKTYTARGYAIYTLAASAVSSSLSVSQAVAIAKRRGYVDLLLVADV